MQAHLNSSFSIYFISDNMIQKIKLNILNNNACMQRQLAPHESHGNQNIFFACHAEV